MVHYLIWAYSLGSTKRRNFLLEFGLIYLDGLAQRVFKPTQPAQHDLNMGSNRVEPELNEKHVGWVRG